MPRIPEALPRTYGGSSPIYVSETNRATLSLLVREPTSVRTVPQGKALVDARPEVGDVGCPCKGGAMFAWTIIVVTIRVAGLHVWLLITHRWDPVPVSPARVQASSLVIAF
jgi:hypothetical protein